MIIVLNILFLIGIAIIGYLVSSKSELKAFYWPGLGLKITAGISVGLLYTYYYSYGDSWAMFNEGIKLKNTAFSSINEFMAIYFRGDYSGIAEYAYVFQPRAVFMSKILAVLAFFTNDNYWLSSCYLSLFSFLGFWKLAKTSYIIFESKWVAVLPTLFFPSIVFWSSGVLKETVAIGAMAWVLAILIRAYVKNKILWQEVLSLIFGLLLVASLKYYYVAVLIVTFTSLFVARFLLPKKSTWYIELASLIFLFAAILGIASLTHPNLWPSRFISVIVDNYYQYLHKSSVENLVIFNYLEPRISSLLFYSPKALLAGLFYPLWLSSFNLVKLAAVMENWLILFSFIYSINQFMLPEKHKYRLLLWAMVLLIITTAIFITFSSPNLGTLVRYKIGYSVVFITLVSGAIRNKLKSLKL